MPRPARLARRIWRRRRPQPAHRQCPWRQGHERVAPPARRDRTLYPRTLVGADQGPRLALWRVGLADVRRRERGARGRRSSEEHTYELQSLMRLLYAVFSL